MTTAGEQLADVGLGRSRPESGDDPEDVVSADASLWVADQGSDDPESDDADGGISRVGPAGAATLFASPNIGSPDAITLGPDGDLWFVSEEANAIGKLSPAVSPPSLSPRRPARQGFPTSSPAPTDASGSPSPTPTRSAP